MMPDIRRFAPKSIIRGFNDYSLPCRCLSAAGRRCAECAPAVKPPTAANRWILWINAQTVVAEMEKHRVQWLVHGHTHRPAVHELSVNDQPAFRVVSAWHHEGSMVKVTPDNVELIAFPCKMFVESSVTAHTQPFSFCLIIMLIFDTSAACPAPHRSFKTHVFPQ